MKKIIMLMCLFSLAASAFAADIPKIKTPQQKVLKAIAEGKVNKVKKLTKKSTKEELANYLFFAAFTCREQSTHIWYRFSNRLDKTKKDTYEFDPFTFMDFVPKCDEEKNYQIIKHLIDTGAPMRNYAMVSSDSYLPELKDTVYKYSLVNFLYYLKKHNYYGAYVKLIDKIDGCATVLNSFKSYGYDKDNLDFWKRQKCYSQSWVNIGYLTQGTSDNPNIYPPEKIYMPFDGIGASRQQLVEKYGSPLNTYNNGDTDIITFRSLEPFYGNTYFVIDYKFYFKNDVAVNVEGTKYNKTVDINGPEDLQRLKDFIYLF